MPRPASKNILLKNSKSKSIVSLDDLIAIHSIDDGADKANVRRYITFDYRGGEAIRVYYGSDDTHHGTPETLAKEKRDSDFYAIENILKPAVSADYQ